MQITTLNELLKIVGLSLPAVYAAATYFLFHRMDLRASGAAKKAVSDWFTRRYDRVEVASAVVEVFDRVYTKPLLGWRAILRSFALSAITTAVFIELMFPAIFYIAAKPIQTELRSMWLGLFATNVVSDYLSLFVIRYWLVLGRNRPLTALITGPIIGAVVVGFCYAVRDIGSFAVDQGGFELRYIGEWFHWVWFERLARQGGANRVFVFAALAVNFWLLFLALGIVVMQVANYMLAAARGAQWFLKQGRHHPFDALGYVVAFIVFVITAGVQFLRPG